MTDEPAPLPLPDEPPPPDKGDPHKKLSDVLGNNRRRGSGVRALTKKDLDQLRGYYVALGFMLMPFNQRAAAAFADDETVDRCVDAWDELAKQNDGVRRGLLMLLEGGAWGLVFSAHMPIIWACIPQRALERMPLMFGKQESEPETEPPSPDAASWFRETMT
jgi:hypothetical protein